MRLESSTSPVQVPWSAFINGYLVVSTGTPIKGYPCHSPVGIGGDGRGAGRARRFGSFLSSVFASPVGDGAAGVSPAGDASGVPRNTRADGSVGSAAV